MPNARLPVAARQLISEIKALVPDAEVKPVPGSLDGLSVHRTIRVDKSTTSQLRQSLGLVAGLDDRITGAHLLFGSMEIGFVPGPQADKAGGFDLGPAAATFGESEVEEKSDHSCQSEDWESHSSDAEDDTEDDDE